MRRRAQPTGAHLLFLGLHARATAPWVVVRLEKREAAQAANNFDRCFVADAAAGFVVAEAGKGVEDLL